MPDCMIGLGGSVDYLGTRVAGWEVAAELATWGWDRVWDTSLLETIGYSQDS